MRKMSLKIASALFFFAFIGSHANAQSPTAEIDSPKNNAQVAGPIEMTGSIKGTVPADAQLWVVVRRGNLMWPKDPEVFVVGETWSKTVNDGGRGRFSLVLFLVGKEGQAQISDWIDHGVRTGDFAGLTRIKDSTALAHVFVEKP